METPIDEFHQQFHKQEIQKLTLHLKYLHILGTLHCVNSLQDEFKRRAVYHSVLCCQDYAEHVVASFHTKLNLNTIVAIYLFILRALNWNTSVIQTSKNHHHPRTFAKYMMCLTIFFQITAKNMQLQHLNIANKSFIFEKQKKYVFWSEQHMGKEI